MAKAGEFKIRVWEGGFPIWCTIQHGNGNEIQINALELRSLAFAVKQARREARQVARSGMDRDRVEDY